MAEALPDYLALETTAWIDIANKVVTETHLTALVLSVEPEARALIAVEWANGTMALCSALARQSLLVSSQHAARAHEASLALQAMESTMKEMPNRMAAAEASMLREMQLKYELRNSEMEEGGAQLEQRHRRVQEEMVELERRRDSAALALNDVTRELDERRERLQDHKIAAADEMNRLESTLESLRSKVAAERAVLQRLEEEESVRRRKAELLAGLGRTEGGAAATSSSADGGAQGAKHPSENRRLDFGLSTLQNVREQLRELREARTPSGSPNRNAAAQASTPNATPYSADAEGSSVNTPYYSATSAISARVADRSSTPAAAGGGGIASPINPWKARLMKLQGDLKTLRADLATTA